MKAYLLAAAVVLLAAAPLHAEDIDQMQSARQDLQSALSHLKTAGHDYAGHRKQAVELVERALGQVSDGIKVGDRRDARDDKKVQQLEHREKKIEHRIDKLKD